MNEFINVKPLWACIQNVLPQVYDDTISYQELLYKVISKLNELVENNNKLPGYIADLIREYISSGEIEKVLAEVLATYMLNVKFPPAGLEPASGDGSKDDTEAIQGCIEYAQSHGGMAVYFPSGSYLCDSLDIAGKCTMFGYDRYNTRIVLKGGATRPLLNGSVDEFSLNGLGFDGNMDIQVNNVNLIDITVGSGIITNVFVTDGYDLIKAKVDVDLQISDVVFNHAVENGLVVSGSGRVVVDSCVFRTVSALIGKSYVKFGVNNSTISNCVMVGSCPVGVEITGNMNHVQFERGACVKSFVDSGEGNTILVNGVEESVKLTGDETVTVGGESVRNYTGDVRINAQGDVRCVVAGDVVLDSSMTKTDSVTGKRTVKSGSVDDSTTGARVVKSQSETRTVDDDSIEVVGGDKNISAGSYHASVNGEFSENVKGNKGDTVVGDVTVDYRKNENVTIGGNKTETVKGIWQESAEGNKIDDVNGNYERHVVGSVSDTVDGIANYNYKSGVIKTVTGGDTENVSGKKKVSANSVEYDATTDVTLNSTDLDLNSTNPIKYKTPAKSNIDAFDTVPFKGRDNIERLLAVFNDNTLTKFNGYDGYQNQINAINQSIEGINNALSNLDVLPFANVKSFGALGNGSADDTGAIQRALDSGYSLVYFPEGVYMVNTLKCPSDKVLIGSNATLKNIASNAILLNKADGSTGDYYANGNITVYNLKFDANQIASSSIGFGHVNRCRIHNCTFVRNPMWHCIELNAAYDCEIINCHFSQYSTNPDIVEQSSEMIQLDAALNENVFPWFGPYDKKGCELIRICGNTFNNTSKPLEDICKNPEKYCAIGNHTSNSAGNETAKRVFVANNMFWNIGRCISFISVVGLTVANNFGDNIACFFNARNVTDRNSYISISNNYIYCNQVGVESGLAEKVRCINFSGGNKEQISNVTIMNNCFYNSGGHGIAANGRNFNIANNYVDCGRLNGQVGIYIGFDNIGFTYSGNTVNSAIYGEGTTPPSDTLVIGNHFKTMKFNKAVASGVTLANNVIDAVTGATVGSSCKILNELHAGKLVTNQNV